MGVKLIVEALDTPLPLTPAQRLILVALAERARDDTRRVLPGREESTRAMLLRRTGLQPGGLAAALTGLESVVGPVREVLGYTKKGRPVYAHRGKRATEFKVPLLPLLESTDEEAGVAAEDVLKGSATAEPLAPEPEKDLLQQTEGSATAEPSKRESFGHSRPLSLSPSEDPSSAREDLAPIVESLLRKHGRDQLDRATAERAAIHIEATRAPRDLAAYVRGFSLSDLRAAGGAPTTPEVKAPRCNDPRCHGGWLPDDEAGRAVPCLTCKPHRRAAVS